MFNTLRLLLAVALAAFAFSPAAAQTAVARLPLKASVLAQPNVIFGMDDSGSMDFETMLDSTEGFLWMDTSSSPPTSWTATGQPIRDLGEGVTGHKYAYLFPVGIAAGAQSTGCANHSFTAVVGGSRYGFCNATGGFGMVAPPVPQLAAARSARFNPIYYNPSFTYKPWPPAYHGGSLKTYGNATATAAQASPQFAGSTTLDLTTTQPINTDHGYHFYAHAGHRLPSGSRICSNTNVPCTSWNAVTTSETLMTDSRFVAVPYYPATYWHAEACTPDNATATSSCVSAPGGGTLKRYEIKSGNSFPSGRSYAAEMQNFANWWQYYRKRVHMLAGSMGTVLENLNGVRMGVVSFNNRVAPTMYDADAADPANNKLAVAGIFYTNPASTATPTRETLNFIGEQFHTNPKVVQFACQRNAAFIVTDGFANASSPAVAGPAYNPATYGSGWPYAVTSANSLADLALSYYTTRLRGSDFPAGRVPLGSAKGKNPDLNPDLHMNTYGIMLGIKGTLWPGVTDAWASSFTWPVVTASGDRAAIDDLWHATINGRGELYLATNPEQMLQGIQAGLKAILSQTGAQGGVSVSTVNLSRGDGRAYFGTYDPSGWVGDLAAYAIDVKTGAVNTAQAIWSAAAALQARDWQSRLIGSHNGSAGVAFNATTLGAAVNPGSAFGNSDDVFAYLRGSRALEGDTFRTRTGLMGAVINSEPVFSRAQSVVYVQSGEGMLHAFGTGADEAGKELWAFVPRRVLGQIGRTTQRSYSFLPQLDGKIAVGRVGSNQTLLVAGMGAAGRGWHALDVSQPRPNTDAAVGSLALWEFPGAADAATEGKMGLAVGLPRIVKTTDDGDVVLVTSGYNAPDGRGRLWMLNATTGAVIHEFDTGAVTAGTDAGLAQVSAYLENTGTVRFVYGGDLQGRLWRFDLKAKSAPHLLAELRNAANQVQPITAAPELLALNGQRVVVVGTGRLLDSTDFGGTQVQSVYAISDGSTLSSPRGSLVAQVYTAGTDTVTSNPVDWTVKRGWVLDLPAGQQAVSQPNVAYGAVAFTTNTAGASDCSASSRLYVLTVRDGSKFKSTSFVSSAISSAAMASGVTLVATSEGQIVASGQDADGKPWQRTLVGSSPIAPAKNAWREIKR